MLQEKKKKFHLYSLSDSKIKWVVLFFVSIGLLTIVNIISDFQSYILNIYLKNDEVEIIGGNKILIFIESLSKYFLPFAVFGVLSLLNIKSKSKITKYFLLLASVVFVLLFSLNSNRQSMVYPVLALIVGFSKYIKYRTLPVIIVGIVSLYLLFSFGNLRDLNYSQSHDSLKTTKQIIDDIQIYAGGAQIIAPVFKYDGFKFTLFNSFISSFPILGEPFREESGTIFYNYLFYGYSGVADQVFLTQAECYLNGGYFLVLVFFIIVGYYYSKLNDLFFNTLTSQFLFVVTFYYLILLFNSTILLSFSVMGQFLFYNSFPALILLFLYRKNRMYSHRLKNQII